MTDGPSFRRGPWRVGHRTLIAKTCLDCDEFLTAGHFARRSGGRGPESYCRKCKSRRVKRAPSQRWETPSCRAQMYGHREVVQDLTRARAHRAGELWTDSDYAVLKDPALTLTEKALRLQRTYMSVANRAAEQQCKSKRSSPRRATG